VKHSGLKHVMFVDRLMRMFANSFRFCRVRTSHTDFWSGMVQLTDKTGPGNILFTNYL